MAYRMKFSCGCQYRHIPQSRKETMQTASCISTRKSGATNQFLSNALLAACVYISDHGMMQVLQLSATFFAFHANNQGHQTPFSLMIEGVSVRDYTEDTCMTPPCADPKSCLDDKRILIWGSGEPAGHGLLVWVAC